MCLPLDNVAKRKGSLWPHCLEEHSGLVPQFKCSVVGRFFNPLDRQLDEAMRIRGEEGQVMNGKEEWVAPADYSIRVERG